MKKVFAVYVCDNKWKHLEQIFLSEINAQKYIKLKQQAVEIKCTMSKRCKGCEIYGGNKPKCTRFQPNGEDCLNYFYYNSNEYFCIEKININNKGDIII